MHSFSPLPRVRSWSVCVALAALWLSPAVAEAKKVSHARKAPAALAFDADADGVRDDQDACPKVAGLSNSDAKQNGCPEKFASGAAGPASATFAGFRLLDNGNSVIFVELTGPIAVEVARVRGKLVYTLVATKVPLRNNKNPLLTGEFASSVVSARLVSSKKAKSAELVVAVRGDVKSTQRISKRDGGALLEIEFPAPTPGSAQATKP